MTIARITSLILVTLHFFTALNAEELNAFLIKARAQIAPESTLDDLRSIHYIGSIINEEISASGEKTKVTIPVEIIFQKPFQQLQVLTHKSKDVMISTAFDGREAWISQQSLSSEAKRSIRILPNVQMRSMRASTWENLYFFKGLEAFGGQIQDAGLEEVDGVKCRKIVFIHDAKNTFARFFNAQTGKLVLSITDSGDTIREEGELRVDGVRFPKKIITSKKKIEGKESTVVIIFDKIVLNEPFSSDRFAAQLIP